MIAPGRHQLNRAMRAVALGALALCCGQSLPALAATPSPVEQKEKLQQLRSRIAEVQKGLDAVRGERDQVSAELRETEREIGRLARRLRVLAGQLERQEEELRSLRGQAAEQDAALAAERGKLARQVNAAYAMGRQERIKILLNQQDPAVISRVLAYYDYLNRERARRMTVIREQLDALRETEQAIAVRQERLRRLRERELAEQSSVEQAQAARRQVLDRLTGEIEDQGQQLTQLRGNEKQLQHLLSRLQEALADIPDKATVTKRFAALRGRLGWPTKGVISNSFGSPKIGSLRWDGVMISAREGSEVYAVHNGRIAFADWLRGFGLLLIVDHGDGYMTLYGHNQSLFKEAGDWVEAGEPVASVGRSGGRDLAGVYFGIRHQGKAINPARWCRRPRGRKVG